MTSAVLACDGNIIENQQFTDYPTNTFVMRTRFETSKGLADAEKSLREGLGKFSPTLHIRPTAQKPKALVLVTTESHCLRDLMYLLELGELPIEIPLVISNHAELQQLVESHGIPFLHLPVNPASKADQEQVILQKIKELKIDFYQANRLQIENGVLTGDLQGEIIDRQAKGDALKQFAQIENVDLRQSIAIGDGANDLYMIELAGLGIAFNAKPAVRAAADAAITNPHLDSVLYLLGISRSEVEALTN